MKKLLLLTILCLCFGLVGCGDSSSDTYDDDVQVPVDTPTPTPLIKLDWPGSDLAQVVPVLNDVYGVVILNNDEEVCMQVVDFSKEQYDEYRAACVKNGYTNTTLDDENWLKASNEDGYRLSLSYDAAASSMSIDIKQPLLKVTVEIECEANLIFSRYDLKISLDGNELGTVEHGSTGSFTAEFEEKGTYTLEICSAEDSSVDGEVNVSVNNSGTYKFVVSCKSSSVEIATVDKLSAPILVSELGTKKYRDVKQMFVDAGFTNVKTQEIVDLPVSEVSKAEMASNITINGSSDFTKDDSFFTDAAVVISYRVPKKITMVKSSEDYEGMNYLDVKKELEELGFVDIELEEKHEVTAYHVTGEVSNVDVYYIFKFNKGEEYEYDETITIKYYVVTEPTPAPTSTPKPTEGPTFYSSNPYDIAKEGNSGQFSYKNKSGSYDIYWIIDFDAGYVYWFTENNGEDYCDKLPIVEGDLNTFVTVSWGDDYYWHLHFKYVNSPVTLIVNDHNDITTEFTTTDLDDALELRDAKRIIEH